MRLLTDQDVYGLTVRLLRDLGHDAVTVREAGLSQATDVDLLSHAAQQERILVSRDRDFGNLVFLQRLGAGVLYLRVSPSTTTAVHAELKRVLKSYTEEELRGAFVVVEPARHRFRRLSR